jgi:hypothetical protein
MARLIPEGQQGLADPGVHFVSEEVHSAETRLRRKMIVNPKRRITPLAVMEQSNKVSTALRTSSPVNLAFAVLSSATFGWLVRNWHGR